MRQEFIITRDKLIELSEKVDSDTIKLQLNLWFPEAFKPQIEIGRWYKSCDGIICISSIKEDIFYYYGIRNENWCDSFFVKGSFFYDSLKPAPKKEVEEALIKEAKKRGLTDGVKYKAPWVDYQRIIEYPLYFYDNTYNVLCDSLDNWIVDDRGNWATLIKQPEEAELQRAINDFKKAVKVVKEFISNYEKLYENLP